MMFAFKEGIEGKNRGLPTGIRKLDNAIYNIQKGAIYGVASAPKVGKSTFVDSAFVISPYLYMLEHENVDIDFIYFSLEMSKKVLRFKAAAHFFHRDYGISSITLEEGKRHKGSPIIPMQSGYLMSRMKHDDNTPIKVQPEHRIIYEKIINDRIIPMYGEYDEKGNKISNGKITLIEDKNNSNPTGIYFYLLDYAKQNGELLYEEFYAINKQTGDREKGKRLSGYIPKNPEKYVIVVLDHLRNMKKEKEGYKMLTLKENMDRMTDYQVRLRNICNFTFVDILHLNRGISDISRIKFSKDSDLYPNSSDLKDSGNLSEDADYLITLFNPGDDRYNIKKHLHMDIEDIPEYRSIHLIESRHTECPVHIQTNMLPGISVFEEL